MPALLPVDDGRFSIIFDRAISERPEFEKTWLLHCRNAPTIEGTGFVVTDGKGRLDGKTLLPEKAMLKSVSGYTYRGQTFDPQPSAQSAVASKWRIEVQPATPTKEDLFLHVLSRDGVKEARLVREKGKVGVRVGSTTLLFDSKIGGTLAMGQHTFPLVNGIRNAP